MKHCSKLKNFWIDITNKRFNNIRDLSTFIALLINTIMLACYSLKIDFYDEASKTY